VSCSCSKERAHEFPAGVHAAAAGESLKVFFDHELFRQYHDQVAPEFGDDDSPLWEQMWEEGLATYISQQMNPGATEAQALMSGTLGGQARAMLPALAQELRSNAESLDKDEYAAFFFGQNSRPDLPPRGAELKAAVMQALEQLATESGRLIAR
jgi:hypothetical protein